MSLLDARQPAYLMEGAVVERLRRADPTLLHPLLVNAPLIYDPAGRERLADCYRDYLHIAHAARLPLLLCSPTWRANRERVEQAEAPGTINADAVSFLRAVAAEEMPESRTLAGGTLAGDVLVGGMLGCRNDCYRPEQGLDAAEAEAFHRWQAESLASAEPDFLIAVTLPAVEEALGLARAMAATGLPYFVSFVIDRHGRVLDGSPLPQAVARLDAALTRPPEGYLVNCAYPSFLCADEQPAALFARLIGLQANASSLDHGELEAACTLQQDDPADWLQRMLALHREHGLRLLGGCCGTGPEHIRGLADGLSGSGGRG